MGDLDDARVIEDSLAPPMHVTWHLRGGRTAARLGHGHGHGRGHGHAAEGVERFESPWNETSIPPPYDCAFERKGAEAATAGLVERAAKRLADRCAHRRDDEGSPRERAPVVPVFPRVAIATSRLVLVECRFLNHGARHAADLVPAFGLP